MPGNDSIITDEEIIARWDRGETGASIARAFGLSRERIRQRLERNGRTGPNQNARPTVYAILQAAESAENRSDLADSLEITSGTLASAISVSNISEEVNDLLRTNRVVRTARSRWAERGHLITQLRVLAQSLGHTPTQHDLESKNIFHASLARVFGSAAVAMKSAGLEPNVPGGCPRPLPPGFSSFEGPTADTSELSERVNRLLHSISPIGEPEGNLTPQTRYSTARAYVRDPAVVAWVLRNASGACEVCGKLGYGTSRARHFLEVHHIVPLSEGGPDVVTNVVAVCETCHGKLHRWIHRERMVATLRETVERLM